MQVGNVSLYPLMDPKPDRIKSPTAVQSKVENLFTPVENKGEMIGAFQNVSLANANYGAEVSAFDIQKASVDHLTAAYNNKSADVNSAELDYTTAAFNTQQLSQSAQSVNNTLTSTQTVIGSYLNQINGSSKSIEALNSSIGDIDQDLFATESVVKNHKSHSNRMKSLESNYNNAISNQSNFFNSINSISQSMANINEQLAALDDPNAVGVNPNTTAINRLNKQKEELEQKYTQIMQDLNENTQIINQFKESEAVVGTHDAQSISLFEAKIDKMQSKKLELVSKKEAEHSKLNDFLDKKGIADKEFGRASGLLESLGIRLEMSQNNETRLLSQLENRKVEFQGIQSPLDNAFVSYQDKEASVQKAETKFNSSMELLNLVTQKYKANRK